MDRITTSIIPIDAMLREQARALQPAGGLPRISIVTPSYNQGQFIEETIRSVIDQRYPNLEYLVLDGGSTDGAVDVIRKYERNISRWVSEPDGGAADAIEKGRQRCTGELFNWLNSDDYLMPATLRSLATIATKYPNFDIYAFIGMSTWPDAPVISHFARWPNTQLELLSCMNVFAQESTFLRMSFLDEHRIGVRGEYHNIYDVILYEEMLAKGARILLINVFGGVFRHHPDAKTSRGTPFSDRKHQGLWQRGLFNRRLRAWRRVYSSRFQQLQRLACRSRLSRGLIGNILGRGPLRFAVCNFVNTQCALPEAWQIA